MSKAMGISAGELSRLSPLSQDCRKRREEEGEPAEPTARWGASGRTRTRQCRGRRVAGGKIARQSCERGGGKGRGSAWAMEGGRRDLYRC